MVFPKSANHDFDRSTWATRELMWVKQMCQELKIWGSKTDAIDM